MYHQINLPECADQLMRLTEIAGHTIAFGLNNDISILDGYVWDGIEQQGLTKALGNNFPANQGGQRLLAATRDRFLADFDSRSQRDIGQWLWGKYAIIAAPLVRLLVIPLNEKSGIIAAFNHDIDITGILGSSGRKCFNGRITSEHSTLAQSLTKEILLNFYERILVGQGIDGEKLGTEEIFDHQAILQSYHKANLQFKVCPGCDGLPPRASASPRHVVQGTSTHPLSLSANLDHFLPKSIYPFLAIHPWNLAPLCTICNQDRKGTKDPLGADEEGSLDNIYHPYLRGAHGDIQVRVDRGASDRRPHLHLHPATDDPLAQARLNSLEYVLGLQADWDGDLQDERLEIEVEAALRHATQDERTANQRESDAWLRDKLSTISQNMNYDIRRKPRTVAIRAYAVWLASDDATEQERLHLLNKALGIAPGVTNPSQASVPPSRG